VCPAWMSFALDAADAAAAAASASAAAAESVAAAALVSESAGSESVSAEASGAGAAAADEEFSGNVEPPDGSVAGGDGNGEASGSLGRAARETHANAVVAAEARDHVRWVTCGHGGAVVAVVPLASRPDGAATFATACTDGRACSILPTASSTPDTCFEFSFIELDGIL